MKGSNGKWHLTLFIQNGRVKDENNYPLMTGLREIAKMHTGDFRLTPNQNLIIGNINTTEKEKNRRIGQEVWAYRWYSLFRIAKKFDGLRGFANLRTCDG